MILDLTKGFVPDVYSESRDYRVFLKLLALLLSVLRDNINSTPSLYSADECPREILPLLAEMVGYKYREERSSEINRMIIKNFPIMLRHRGSRAGIKIATALSLNSLPEAPEYSLDSIIVDYDYDKNEINIYYPRAKSVLDRDLLEAVRPLGSRLNTVPSSFGTTSDDLEVKSDVYTYQEDWDSSRTEVEKSKVGQGDVRPSTIERKEEEEDKS